MVSCKSTAEEVSFQSSHHRISLTDSKVKLYFMSLWIDFSCDFQRNADESIARQVADYMLHARSLPRSVAKGREVFNFI